MKWVEKSSIEKIRRLLKIFERERHCQVLLTRKNISTVKEQSGSLYSSSYPSAAALECRGGGTLCAYGYTTSCF